MESLKLAEAHSRCNLAKSILFAKWHHHEEEVWCCVKMNSMSIAKSFICNYLIITDNKITHWDNTEKKLECFKIVFLVWNIILWNLRITAVELDFLALIT